jgi:hypothetical protein
MPPSDRRRTPLLPATVAGLALLLFGVIVLLVGGLLSGANATEVDLWFVGVGLLLLLGALFATVLSDPAPRRAPRAAPARPAALAPRPASPASQGPAPEVSSGRAGSRATRGPVRSPSVFTVASSIPGQLDGPSRAGASAAMGPAPWDEPTRAGVSLPFSAIRGPEGPGASRYGAFDDDAPYPTVESLEEEVERLREKVRELEHPELGGYGPTDPPSLMASTSLLTGPRPPEPPSPDARSLQRACTGCGAGLPGGTTDPLCWGCGRPLCATCYWRTKEGAAAHTCPTCFAKAGGTNVSSGRGPPMPPTPDAARAVPAAMSRR